MFWSRATSYLEAVHEDAIGTLEGIALAERMRSDLPVYEDPARRSILSVQIIRRERLGSKSLRNESIASRKPLEQVLVLDIVNRDVEMLVALGQWRVFLKLPSQDG